MQIAVANAWAATLYVAVNFKTMKESRNLALAGIFTALCVVVLFIGAVFQTLDLSAAAFGSIITLIAFIEMGKKWAWGVYFASSLLSLLLLPYKTPAAVFALFAGFYPIIKVSLNRIKPKWLSYIARITCFNLCLVVFAFVSTKLGLTTDITKVILWSMFALCNITFIVFDFALERISVTYVVRIRPKIFGRR